MRHLALPIRRTTTIVENKQRIAEFEESVRRVHAEQEQIMTERQSSPERGQSIGIRDMLINDLVKSSLMLIEDVRAVADWSVTILNR